MDDREINPETTGQPGSYQAYLNAYYRSMLAGTDRVEAEEEGLVQHYTQLAIKFNADDVVDEVKRDRDRAAEAANYLKQLAAVGALV